LDAREFGIASLLLDKEVDISICNDDDGTVLMMVAKSSMIELVERLCYWGVDVNQISEPYHNALIAAA
jgi:ankyrin repeat protein